MDDINQWTRSEIKAHRRKVFCLGWNCEGSRLATGSQDQTIRIWKMDGASPQPSKHEAELRGHTDTIMYMRWHPSHPDKLASAATNEKCVRFWDTRAAKNTATLGTPGQNLYLAWTSDGNYMAVANKDDVVSVVDVRKMKITGRHSHKYRVNELAFLAGSRLLLQATGNAGEVEVLRWPEARRAGAMRGHTAQVLSLAVDPGERYVASGGADAVCCLWETRDLICLRTYVQMDHPIRALSFSHDSRYLAMAGEDPCVFVEDVESGRSLGRVALRASPEDCAWHPRQHVLAYPVEAASESNVELRSRRPE